MKSNSAIRTSFLVTTCFLNKYVISLLSQYGINNLDNINIVSDINGNTVGWTLGYLIALKFGYTPIINSSYADISSFKIFCPSKTFCFIYMIFCGLNFLI